ncbi:MAG: hypothetical protein ABI596_11210 [Pyrinomonadaceae bacterium]
MTIMTVGDLICNTALARLLINLAHAAGAKQPLNLVMAQTSLGSQGHALLIFCSEDS